MDKSPLLCYIYKSFKDSNLYLAEKGGRDGSPHILEITEVFMATRNPITREILEWYVFQDPNTGEIGLDNVENTDEIEDDFSLDVGDIYTERIHGVEYKRRVLYVCNYEQFQLLNTLLRLSMSTPGHKEKHGRGYPTYMFTDLVEGIVIGSLQAAQALKLQDIPISKE